MSFGGLFGIFIIALVFNVVIFTSMGLPLGGVLPMTIFIVIIFYGMTKLGDFMNK